MSRVALQVVLGLVALVALITGTESLLHGALDPLYGLTSAASSLPQVHLDTNHRYFAGLWLGVGLVLVALIPRIERHREALKVLALMVFVGGVGRMVSMVQHGLPHPGYIAAAAAELLFPLLLPWQRALAAKLHAPAGGFVHSGG